MENDCTDRKIENLRKETTDLLNRFLKELFGDNAPLVGIQEPDSTQKKSVKEDTEMDYEDSEADGSNEEKYVTCIYRMLHDILDQGIMIRCLILLYELLATGEDFPVNDEAVIDRIQEQADAVMEKWDEYLALVS